jgi:hypothetical protein
MAMSTGLCFDAKRSDHGGVGSSAVEQGADGIDWTRVGVVDLAEWIERDPDLGRRAPDTTAV